MNELPEGWIRNPQYEIGSVEAPYIYEPTGKKSWKNPNHNKIMNLVNTANKMKYSNTSMVSSPPSANKYSDKHNKMMIKKLRLMLQAGAPLHVVERRAAIENINMEAVLGVIVVDRIASWMNPTLLPFHQSYSRNIKE